MARPRKSGLDYFPFDVTFFTDKKIKILKARYGASGVTIYLYLLCEIYKNGYYIVWDDDYKYLIADDLNLSDGLIEQVMKFLVERSLLTSILLDPDTILTSPGIQRRYQEAVKTRANASKKPVDVRPELWLLSKDETQSSVNTMPENVSLKLTEVSSEETAYSSVKNDTKESKGKRKKIKEKECVETTPPTLSEVSAYCVNKGYRFSPERFIHYYAATGWQRHGTPIKDWKSLADNWGATERSGYDAAESRSSFDIEGLSKLGML